MSHSKIIISIEDALNIISEHNFSKLYEALPYYYVEPFLALFAYGLTYAHSDKFQAFTIKHKLSRGSGEYSDGETMDWIEPMLHFNTDVFEAFTNNVSVKKFLNPAKLTDFDSQHSGSGKNRLPDNFKLRPNKGSINLFLHEIYIDKENPFNEKEIHEAKELVFQEVIQIKEKYHLETMMSISFLKESKKQKI